MITQETRDELVRLFQSIQDFKDAEIMIGDDTLCDCFDAIIDHISLSDLEDSDWSELEAGDEGNDDDVGNEIDSEFAHRAMHWAFELGLAVMRLQTS